MRKTFSTPVIYVVCLLDTVTRPIYCEFNYCNQGEMISSSRSVTCTDCCLEPDACLSGSLYFTYSKPKFSPNNFWRTILLEMLMEELGAFKTPNNELKLVQILLDNNKRTCLLMLVLAAQYFDFRCALWWNETQPGRKCRYLHEKPVQNPTYSESISSQTLSLNVIQGWIDQTLHSQMCNAFYIYIFIYISLYRDV